MTNAIHNQTTKLARHRAVHFLHWWWHGLFGLWSFRETPKQFINQTAQGLEIFKRFADTPRTVALDNTVKLASVIGSTDCYLLAPSDHVIHTKVPETLRNLPLTSITESLLPFNIGELHVASNVSVEDIFAIARADIDHSVSYLRSIGLTITGVAFRHNSEFHYRAFDSGDSPNKRAKAKRSIIRLAAFAVVALILVLALQSYQSERQLQASLSAKLSELEMQSKHIIEKQTGSINSLAANQTLISPWQASKALNALEALLKAMPAGAELSQITLNKNELLVDGSAPSATAVQAQLEKSTLFTDSEFVAAISSDPNNKTERFRLRSSLGKSK